MAKVPLSDKPGIGNWVERYNALPKGSWIRRAAEHLKGKGKSDGHAIAIAVNAAKKICSSGDLNFPGLQQVNPKSKAEACAAVAVWEKAKARAKAADLSAPALEAFAIVELAKPHHVAGGHLDVREPSERAVLELTAEWTTNSTASP